MGITGIDEEPFISLFGNELESSIDVFVVRGSHNIVRISSTSKLSVVN
jgi:hypothetical protein